MRLIDADDLIKNRVENDPVRIAAMCAPTAFDVDKVMKELEEKSNDAVSNIFAYEDDDHEGIYNDGLSDGYGESIEIVRAGLKVQDR